jgi:hypothetical protein
MKFVHVVETGADVMTGSVDVTVTLSLQATAAIAKHTTETTLYIAVGFACWD